MGFSGDSFSVLEVTAMLLSESSTPATSATTSGRSSHESEETQSSFTIPNPPTCISHRYKPMAVLSGHAGAVSCLALCGEFIISGSRGDDMVVWQQPDLKEFARFGHGDGAVKAVVTSGNRVFTAHQDSRIRVWRVTRDPDNVFKLVSTLPTARDYLGKIFRQSNYVQIRRHHKRLWIEHSDTISCLDVSNGFIYSGSWDKTIKIWRLSDCKCLESIDAHNDAVTCLVSRNGIVYSASADGTIKAWCRDKRTKSHLLRGIIEGHAHKDVSMNSLAVSEDGRFIYGGGSDGRVIVWTANEEFDSWKTVCSIKAHTMSVLCVCLVGEFLCCGSADKSISVWRIGEENRSGLSLKQHVVVRGHQGAVKCLQSSSSLKAGGGFVLYSGSIDKSVRVWWIPSSANGENGEGLLSLRL